MFTESSAGYAGIILKQSSILKWALPYWKAITNKPQNTIIGGASLWVMAGHSKDEYKGAGEFLSFLSSSDVQAKWHQNTGYLPITVAAGDATRASAFIKRSWDRYCRHSNDSKSANCKL